MAQTFSDFAPVANHEEALREHPRLAADVQLLLSLRFQLQCAWRVGEFLLGYRSDEERQRLHEMLRVAVAYARSIGETLWPETSRSYAPVLRGGGRSAGPDVVSPTAAAFLIGELLSTRGFTLDGPACHLLRDLTFAALGDVTYAEIEARTAACSEPVRRSISTGLRWLKLQVAAELAQRAGDEGADARPEPMYGDDFDFGFETTG